VTSVLQFFSLENRRVLSNAFYLSLMQVANFGLPLLTVPYLIRMLGVELFGMLAFVSAVMNYVSVIIDYGFNLTAARDVACNRDDLYTLNLLFNNIQTFKSCLITFSVIILALINWKTDFLHEYAALYWLTFFSIVVNAYFPTWFFQGIEKMHFVSMINILSKLVFTVGVFVFVRDKNDYLLVPFLAMVGAMIPLLISIWLLTNRFGLRFQKPNLFFLKKLMITSWYVFLSQLKITLFSSTNIVLLGMISGPIAVGYYVAAEKVMRALALAQSPITNALFPFIAKKMQENKSGAISLLKKISFLGSGIYILVLSLFFYFSNYLVVLLYSDTMEASVWVLKVILIVPLLIFLNNIFGTQILLNTGRDKSFFYVLLFAAVLSLSLCFILTYYFSYQGTAIALLVTELFIVIAFFFLVRKDLLYA